MRKYIDADRLHAEIEKTYKSEIQPWLSGVSATSAIYDYVLPLIDSLQQEQPEVDLERPIPNDLEEAAREYAHCPYTDENGNFHENAINASTYWNFIDGAKWQKEQMMKEAVEAHIYQSTNPVSKIGHQLHQAALLYEDKENAPYLKAGDKVKLIIVKEEEE